MNRTAIIFHRFGPYHHARLQAAQREVEVVGIELSAVDATYAWAPEPAAKSFRHVTLFHDRDTYQEKGCEIRHRVHAALDEIKPAVVAIPGWENRGALAALAWCSRRGVPAIVMSESTAWDAPRVWWKEAIKRQVIGLCQAGLVGGTPHHDYLAGLGMPKDRIFVGYDVVDNDHFWNGACLARGNAAQFRRNLSLPEKFFLASNRFIAKKNLLCLFQAYAQYRASAPQESWPLVLLGDGELRKELESVRDQLGLREAVLMPGFKQYPELPAYYGLASAFVHASTIEPWGLVVNEAMAAGLPVIVSRSCGCARDLVQDGRNGFTFNPLDPGMLAAMLGKVAGQEDRHLAAMGYESRQIVARWSPAAFGKNVKLAVEAAGRIPVRKPGIRNSLLLRSLIHLVQSA